MARPREKPEKKAGSPIVRQRSGVPSPRNTILYARAETVRIRAAPQESREIMLKVRGRRHADRGESADLPDLVSRPLPSRRGQIREDNRHAR